MSRLPRPVSIRNQPYALPLALLCAQSVLLAVAPPAAQAQPYPSRALRIVVPSSVHGHDRFTPRP